MKRLIISATALFAFVAPPVFAHHSFAAFDQARTLELDGVVKEFQWTNPHSWIILSVSKDGVDQVWTIEALSPSVLSRMGWKRNLLKPGDKVKATIHPVRDGAPGGNLVTIVRATGEKIGGVTE